MCCKHCCLKLLRTPHASNRVLDYNLWHILHPECIIYREAVIFSQIFQYYCMTGCVSSPDDAMHTSFINTILLKMMLFFSSKSTQASVLVQQLGLLLP